MEKRRIIPIIIIILVVCISGYLILTENNPEHQHLDLNNNGSGIIDSSGNIKVGNITYSMPEGFNKGEANSQGDISISDGSKNIYLSSYDDGNISHKVSEYINYTAVNNNSTVRYDFSVNNISVTKVLNTYNGANHYWFAYDGKVYTIYTAKDTENDDEIFIDLINKIK